MRKYIPEITEIRKTILSKPVLFKTDFEFLILNCNTKFYKQEQKTEFKNIKILPPKTFVDKKL